MKIRVERDVLAEAVAWAARSLPARPPVPVLAGLLLKAEDGSLSLSGFDYEVSARVSVEADVEEDGTVLVSGRLLADICRALPNRPVEISTDGVRVTVVCGSSRFTLHTLPVEEYPSLPQMPTATGTVPGEVFASAVAQVAIAVDRDDTLPVLTGVRIEIEGDTVTLASTDRYRFAVREFMWKPETPDISAVALVPAKTLLDTAKSLSGGDTVSLALSGSGAGEGLIGFEGAGRRTTTRLLEGDLPKYRTLFPTEFNSVAVIETAPFVEAVKRVALVAERNTPRAPQLRAGRAHPGGSAPATTHRLWKGSTPSSRATTSRSRSTPASCWRACPPSTRRSPSSPSPPPPSPRCSAVSLAVDAEADEAYKYLIMPVRLSG
ncbi:DNA polymerase III subunit beta [Streptomyces olivoverticillatus]